MKSAFTQEDSVLYHFKRHAIEKATNKIELYSLPHDIQDFPARLSKRVVILSALSVILHIDDE